MIKRITRLINRISRIKGTRPNMNQQPDPDKPLYGFLGPDRCQRCGGPMIEVNAHTHKMACADSMCRR